MGFSFTSNTLPDISINGFDSQISTQIYLCTLRGQNGTIKLGVYFWNAKLLCGGIARQFASIIFLTIKDAGMLYRTSNACLPILLVGTIILLGAISKGQFKYTAESTLLTNHAVVLTRGDNLVGPPAWGDLNSEGVLTASL